MNCHESCKYFNKIANTNEMGAGICKIGAFYSPTTLDEECPYAINKEYKLTCKDCARFNEDFACYTAQENDLVKDCSGFIDKLYEGIGKLTIELLLQNRYDREKLIKYIDLVIKNYKLPEDEEQ